jgi:hypothetical protein
MCNDIPEISLLSIRFTGNTVFIFVLINIEQLKKYN